MKVTELVSHWRAEAAESSTSDPVAHYQLMQCARELESAIEAAVPPLVEQCDCGHALSRHGASGCLAPAPLGSHRTFCECRRQVIR